MSMVCTSFKIIFGVLREFLFIILIIFSSRSPFAFLLLEVFFYYVSKFGITLLYAVFIHCKFCQGVLTFWKELFVFDGDSPR